MKRIVLLTTLFLALAQCTHNAMAQGIPISKRKIGSSPEVGATSNSHVVQGEAVYAEFDYELHTAVRLLEDVDASSKAKFSVGDILLGYLRKKNKNFCVFDPNQTYLGIKLPGYACLVLAPGKADRFVAAYLIAPGAQRGRRKNLRKHVTSFEWTQVPRAAVRQSRNEIVFQGAAGGILRLLYREFKNDLARPAFSQDLTYDMGKDWPMTVAVKGVRIEILEANNNGIRYRVTQGFN